MKRLLALGGVVALILGPTVSHGVVTLEYLVLGTFLKIQTCTDQTSCLNLCRNYCDWPAFSGQIIWGTANNDNLQGGGLDDCIVGNGGDDRITGNQGNDCIITLNGNDTVAGGSGDDVLIDFGGNNPRLNGEAGDDVIISGARCALNNNVTVGDWDTCGGDDVIAGGSGDDLIQDFGGNNSILGEQGSDRITVFNTHGSSQHSLVVGGSGNDIITTHGGNHTLRGEGDNDNLSAFDNVSNLDGGSGTDACAGGAIQTSCNP